MRVRNRDAPFFERLPHVTRSVSALNLRLSPPMLLSPLVYATYDLMWNQECHT